MGDSIRILVRGDFYIGNFAKLLTHFQFQNDGLKTKYHYYENSNYSGKDELQRTELQIPLNDTSLKILRAFMVKQKIENVLIDSLSQDKEELEEHLTKAGINSKPEKVTVSIEKNCWQTLLSFFGMAGAPASQEDYNEPPQLGPR